MSIEIKNIKKRFGDFTALDGISLHVPAGELVALLGPSGSGKTSLLRIIAGLELPDEGTVLFEGEDATLRRARDRGVGFVFQHYALFRHLTVFENVAFGLRVRKAGRPSESEIAKRVNGLLDLVQLAPLARRYPSQLSGGQRQRVALARALAVEPKVLLLDEPFGSLDATVRLELRRFLRRLHDEIRVTSVFVTHDQEEALEVADRIVVINRGRVEQVGSPEEVFDHPATPFVMSFLGHTNIFHGRIEGGKARLGSLTVDAPELSDASTVSGFVRPHELEISRTNGKPGGVWTTLVHANPAGALVKLDLADGEGRPLQAVVSRDFFRLLEVRAGEALYVRPRSVRIFAATSSEEPLSFLGEAI
ncbi:MAG: TOBE-like domain-containing protein [Thermoanaerobaculia bacterium]|nr:TOBE-like domain-containing protein [Thermoanaerobaculia bacterium]